MKTPTEVAAELLEGSRSERMKALAAKFEKKEPKSETWADQVERAKREHAAKAGKSPRDFDAKPTSKHFVGENILEDRATYDRMKEARQRMEHHNRRVIHHEGEQERAGQNYAKIAHHQVAADHHEKAYGSFSSAYNHYALRNKESGDAAFSRGERHAKAAKAHAEQVHESRLQKTFRDTMRHSRKKPEASDEEKRLKQALYVHKKTPSLLGPDQEALLKKHGHIKESIDEGLAAKVAGHAARLAVTDRHVGLHQFGDVAQAGAEYAVHKGEEILKSKLKSIKRGARKAVRAMTAPRKQAVTEMTRKDQIDDVGRHHSGLMTKGTADSKYHTIMRNRASRLKHLRDKSGPNAPQTKTKAGRQRMLSYAGEDSREAKKLKP